jgi:prepilin-type N-terminal cleavage/methylation domain-containing protein
MTSEQIERVRSAAGYTIIELLVAVAIFVVLASAGLPHIDTRRQDIQTVTQQVISDYRWARARAITSGDHFSFAWTGSSTYEIQRMKQEGADWTLDEVVKAVTLPATITRTGSTTAADFVEFNTRGMAVSTETMVWQRLLDAMGGSGAWREVRVWPSGQASEYHG